MEYRRIYGKLAKLLRKVILDSILVACCSASENSFTPSNLLWCIGTYAAMNVSSYLVLMICQTSILNPMFVDVVRNVRVWQAF
jgi:hypothetical protein